MQCFLLANTESENCWHYTFVINVPSAGCSAWVCSREVYRKETRRIFGHVSQEYSHSFCRLFWTQDLHEISDDWARIHTLWEFKSALRRCVLRYPWSKLKEHRAVFIVRRTIAGKITLLHVQYSWYVLYRVWISRMLEVDWKCCQRKY